MKCAILVRSLNTGGVEKSLVNLLNYCAKNEVDLDLFVFCDSGTFLKEIPKSITLKKIPGNNDILAFSQKNSKNKGLCFKIKRSFCALWSKLFTNKMLIKKMLNKIPKTNGYDVVISFQDTPNNRSLYYGPAEVALNKFGNAKKIIFIHSDFEQSGLNNNYVLNQLERFDKIVFVSKSCKKSFDEKHKHLSFKTDYCYNMQNVGNIINLAKEKLNVKFSTDIINFITVARLGKEKAHLRTLRVLKKLKDEGYNFMYHIVGDGSQRDEIHNYIKNNNLENNVFMYGNQGNPYKFINASDAFLLFSYHEAAPMVIDESYILGKPVFSTKTISADEFIKNKEHLCENNEEGIYALLKKSLENYKMNHESFFLAGESTGNESKFQKFKEIINFNKEK